MKQVAKPDEDRVLIGKVVAIELNDRYKKHFESSFKFRNFIYGVLCPEQSINIISEQQQLICKYLYRDSKNFYPYQQANDIESNGQKIIIRNANNFEIKELLRLLKSYPSENMTSECKNLYYETMPYLEEALHNNKYDIYIKGHITLYDH